MITEIKSVEINETEVILEGINLETIFTSENLVRSWKKKTCGSSLTDMSMAALILSISGRSAHPRKNARMLRAWGRNWKSWSAVSSLFPKISSNADKKAA